MLRELRKARETGAEGEWFCALFLPQATFPNFKHSFSNMGGFGLISSIGFCMRDTL
jgi:hypothetical protein